MGVGVKGGWEFGSLWSLKPRRRTRCTEGHKSQLCLCPLPPSSQACYQATKHLVLGATAAAAAPTVTIMVFLRLGKGEGLNK